MTIALLVMTDGRRECIDRAIPSVATNIEGPITRRIIHDDSGDEGYRDWLRERFPHYELIYHPAGRQGFGGAYRNAWRFLTGVREPWVFSTEDDFTFNRPVDLVPMMTVLRDRPSLVQIALRRQPWNAEECAAGGVVESHPDDYAEQCHRSLVHGELRWLSHRRFFTTNSSLFRRTLCYRGWPAGEHSEGVFTHQLLADPSTRFGYWGARNSGEAITHIGDQRVGLGY